MVRVKNPTDEQKDEESWMHVWSMLFLLLAIGISVGFAFFRSESIVTFSESDVKDFFHIDVQQLLEPTPGCKMDFVPTTKDLIPVKSVMDRGVEQLRDEGVVFILLNGKNEGLYFPWTLGSGCMKELAQTAAQVLEADEKWLQNGVKFMSQMGLPVTTAEQLHEERIVHVLLNFMIWTWPGYVIDGQHAEQQR